MGQVSAQEETQAPAEATEQDESKASKQTQTWDAKHATSQIALKVVYFVPADRNPLFDWKDRLEYYCGRITKFHQREFQGQSTVTAEIHSTPFLSKRTTDQLRRGDANAIFFRTLQEVAEELEFGKRPDGQFPILLVLSDINHRPLDDFYRLTRRNGQLEFEGILTAGNHFPGSKLGGARATYLSDRGIGWGLVSADGWRVPYRGSDCVIYHEGLGHTVGLPHPEPGDRSVMSTAQYHGWLSESWINDDQKRRLGWQPTENVPDKATELFTTFRAVPVPPQPRPGQLSRLKLDLPADCEVKTLRVRYQTSIDGPWVEAAQMPRSDNPEFASLGVFDRPTPVSYRVDLETHDGSVQLWGYFQVRNENNDVPKPVEVGSELAEKMPFGDGVIEDPPAEKTDLLTGLDPKNCFTVGTWKKEGDSLVSSKGYGVRLELPHTPPKRYRLTAIVEPLDDPNGLLFGLRNSKKRFVVLVNHTSRRDASTALENVDGRNVGNETTYVANLLQKNRLAQIVATVQDDRVQVRVDGRLVIDWKGSPDQLSLSDYWKTPNDQSLFLGTYDCGYRFHQITIEPF